MLTEKYMTPYKYNKPVISGSGIKGNFDYKSVDCPFVFFHNDKFYMLYIGFDGIGYQTALASSNNLLDWAFETLVLPREKNNGWDKVGAAGTWIIRNDDINGLPLLKKINGRFWMIYHSYPGEGYETGPAKMGLAWCENEDLHEWHRLPTPVFSWEDGAPWELGGLYKGCLIEKDGRYFLYYNAKNATSEGGQDETGWIEQTGLAFSDDMMNWTRYEKNPILKTERGTWQSRFVSDPCVVRDKSAWVMFYFGFDGKHAQEGIAFSEDMYYWNMNDAPIIRHGKSGELDEIHAHKPSVIRYKNVLYHYYCACRRHITGDVTNNFGEEFRCITVATSKKI